jgi:hypothetical protein
MIPAYFQRPESSTIQINIKENLAKGRSRMYTPEKLATPGTYYIQHRKIKTIAIATRVVTYFTQLSFDLPLHFTSSLFHNFI